MTYNRDFVKASLGDIDKPYVCASCPYCNGTKDPTIKFPENKPDPWTWWKKQLNSPKYTVAPMVDQSELPFRMLCRKYGATLAYTPMFHSRSFAESAEYRRLQFSTCEQDRPLFVQFCGHDADTVYAAAKHVENDCDAVDLNLGCPQGIARRGHYGSFLMEEWDTIHCIVHKLRVELACPVTVKMRRFDQLDLTLKYARMLRDAGAHIIAMHGRTRFQKGADTGMADLSFIEAVKKEITEIPILANGNILTFADCGPNMEATKCDGVMSAEALLWDARLFSDPKKPILTGRGYHMDKVTRLEAVDTAKEYLDFVSSYPVDLGMVKAHLFKMLYHSFEVHQEFRGELGAFDCNSVLQAANDAAEKRQQETSAAAPPTSSSAGSAPETLCPDCPESVVVASSPPATGSSSTRVNAGLSTEATTTAAAVEKKKRRTHDDDSMFRDKLALMYDIIARCRAAEEACDQEGPLDKKSSAIKKAAAAAAADENVFEDGFSLF